MCGGYFRKLMLHSNWLAAELNHTSSPTSMCADIDHDVFDRHFAAVGEGDVSMTRDDMSHRQAVLAEIFEFSPTDIAANRIGKMSTAQKSRIAHAHYANTQTAWIVFAIIFGLGLLGFSAEMIRTGNMGAQSLLTYFGVTAFFGFVVGAVILYYRHQTKRTLRQGSVQPVEGKIQLTTERSERLLVRYFGIGRHRFRIDQYQHFVMLQQSGVAGQNAIMYVSAPLPSVLSVVLQA